MSHDSILAATAKMAISSLDSGVIIAANNCLNGWGEIPEGSIAYKPLLDLTLIDEAGNPRDAESLLKALSLEITDRLAAGTL